MSKKDKSKFRRRLKAQILQEMAKVQVQPASTAEISPIAKPIMPPKIEPVKKPTSEVGLQVGASALALQLIRHDLKKSALIIGSIIILIVVLYFVDQKTGVLLKAGNEIFKILHIGT